jgi:hypothetical protein
MEWTEARTGADWALLSNELMAFCLTAAVAGDEVTANAWRVLSDKAWENSLEAYERLERRLEQVKDSSWA